MKIIFNIKPKKYEALLKRQKNFLDKKRRKNKPAKIIKISENIFESLFNFNKGTSEKNKTKNNIKKEKESSQDINNLLIEKENTQNINNLLFDMKDNSLNYSKLLESSIENNIFNLYNLN